MFKTKLLALVFVGAMAASTGFAEDIVVQVAPPRVRVEKRGRAPGSDYVWQSGYHRWDGKAYAWESGRWARAPRPRARWIAPRWEHRKNGWFFIEGRWA